MSFSQYRLFEYIEQTYRTNWNKRIVIRKIRCTEVFTTEFPRSSLKITAAEKLFLVLTLKYLRIIWFFVLHLHADDINLMQYQLRIYDGIGYFRAIIRVFFIISHLFASRSILERLWGEGPPQRKLITQLPTFWPKRPWNLVPIVSATPPYRVCLESNNSWTQT